MSSTQIPDETASARVTAATNDTAAQITKVDSKWTSHYFTAELFDGTYTFRVLKMNQSLFIYIGQNGCESFDELAMAMPITDYVGTTIIGTQHGSESEELAQQLTRRLKKQVFVSYNLPLNAQIRLMLVKRIAEEMKSVPDAF